MAMENPTFIEDFPKKTLYICRGFSIAMFDSRGCIDCRVHRMSQYKCCTGFSKTNAWLFRTNYSLVFTAVYRSEVHIPMLMAIFLMIIPMGYYDNYTIMGYLSCLYHYWAIIPTYQPIIGCWCFTYSPVYPHNTCAAYYWSQNGTAPYAGVQF